MVTPQEYDTEPEHGMQPTGSGSNLVVEEGADEGSLWRTKM